MIMVMAWLMGVPVAMEWDMGVSRMAFVATMTFTGHCRYRDQDKGDGQVSHFFIFPFDMGICFIWKDFSTISRAEVLLQRQYSCLSLVHF